MWKGGHRKGTGGKNQIEQVKYPPKKGFTKTNFIFSFKVILKYGWQQQVVFGTSGKSQM